MELRIGAHAGYVGAKKVNSRQNNSLKEGPMRPYKELHPSAIAASETHWRVHASRLGAPADAEDDGVPCALTTTTPKAIAANSLENMEVFLVFFLG